MHPKPKEIAGDFPTGDKGDMAKNANNGKRAALDILVRQNRSVSAPTEDFSERTQGMKPDDFSREFDKSVSGHVGFGSSVSKEDRRGS